MRTGKLAEPVIKRSVLRQLNMEVSGVRGHYGADCVSLCAERSHILQSRISGAGSNEADGCVCSRELYTSVGPVPGAEYRPGYQVTEAANRMAAGGAVPCGLMLQAVLPEAYEESDLRSDMKQIALMARRYGIKIEDAQIHVSDGVLTPQYFVTAVGYAGAGESELLKPGQELVMTKWIALAGTALLADVHGKELRGRYPFSLIDRAKEFDKLVSVAEEARAISHFGACAMHHLSQGGIFNALWEMADRAGVGLEVDIKKIPVKQETIEICEYFDINPYYLYSAGALLIGTDRAEALIAQLAEVGVPSAVIGRVTDGNDRVLQNGEECRFLDRPKQDEWYRQKSGRKHV